MEKEGIFFCFGDGILHANVGRGAMEGCKFSQIRGADHRFIQEDGGYSRYEVFQKRLNRRFATVSYPSSKAFGKWAWTCMTLEEAEKRLEEIGNAGKTAAYKPLGVFL